MAATKPMMMNYLQTFLSWPPLVQGYLVGAVIMIAWTWATIFKSAAWREPVK